MSIKFQYLPIHALQPGRHQTRRNFDDENLQELALSIKGQGIIEPLVVRELKPMQYEIIAGERRWRAAMKAGLVEVPCVCGQYDEIEACVVTLIENIQRQNLNPIEEAAGYRKLIDEFNLKQEEIAAAVGKSRSHIANLLRLLTLCSAVQQLLKEEQLSLGHARMLVGLSEKEQQQLAQRIVNEQWSVRRIEQAIKHLKAAAENNNLKARQRDIARLKTVLSEQLGAPVDFDDSPGGGWVKIKYFNNDTLAGILERFGLNTEELG